MFTIYGASNCRYCIDAIAALENINADYEYYDIKAEANKDKLAFVLSEGHKTVPQIYHHATYIGGFTELAEDIRQGKYI